MNSLDDLLAEPLADIADDGFSARVLRRVELHETHRRWLLQGAVALGALALVPFIPAGEIAGLFGRLTPNIASSAALAFAAGALILTFSLEQRLRE